MPLIEKEKIKPFRLVKYFTIISLVVIFIGAFVLSFLNIHWARAMQLKKSEEYALVLVENLNHQVFLQFIIPVVLKFGKIELSNPDQFERMDTIVRSTLHSFKVEMVNIYDTNNTISYSFDKQLVGRKNMGGTGYEYAISGTPTSTLVQRGNFWEIPLGFPKESRLTTFAPIRAERQFLRISGPVLGVVEIVQDISEDYQTILSFQLLVIATCIAVMSILSGVLIYVVQRGEAIIQQRTQEQLSLKEKLAQSERLSSLGGMVAGISHEIRNPLGIIRSSAELLKKKVAQFDPTNSIPDIIVEESSRLNLIITDFLNFAKPRPPHRLACQLEDILEKNINFITPQIQDQGYIIVKNFSHHLPEIQADSDMLYQAFLNIFMNAIQAMPDGGKIWVGIQSDSRIVTVCIEDEGPGVPEDLLERIWDPFFTTKEKGTGLGLGIVKNIIESHSGGIRVENREEVPGVRVIIELPITTHDESADQ
ncbi:MAG: two-component sensor histidine kinase [Deltaproteobacteria bacterium]|nr:two-component sensor histidine kinase [Deltaproteobacteria bacterium]